MFDDSQFHLALSGDDPKSLPEDDGQKNKTIWIIVLVVGILMLCSMPWGIYRIAFAKPPSPTPTQTRKLSSLEPTQTETPTATASPTPTASDTPTASLTPTDLPTQTPRIVTQIVEVEATRQVFIVKTVVVPQPILVTVVVTASPTPTPSQTPTLTPTQSDTPSPSQTPTLTPTPEVTDD